MGLGVIVRVRARARARVRVTVRKQGPRELTVEGPFCADYLRVQELLYSQFQTV